MDTKTYSLKSEVMNVLNIYTLLGFHVLVRAMNQFQLDFVDGNEITVYSVAFLQGANSTNSRNNPIFAAATEDKMIKFWQFGGTL
jgi:hypothetical protein